MGFTQPDTPPTEPGQGPAAPNAGPAPVPFTGDQSAGNAPLPSAAPVPRDTPGAQVMGGVTGANHVSEAPWAAPNVNPYEAGSISPIFTGGDADPGGRDDVRGSVGAAVAAAEARFGEHQGDTYAQGSVIGDLMSFPSSPLDPPAGPGLTDPAGAFYDPPRNY
jgi:hypothetical protein